MLRSLACRGRTSSSGPTTIESCELHCSCCYMVVFGTTRRLVGKIFVADFFPIILGRDPAVVVRNTAYTVVHCTRSIILYRVTRVVGAVVAHLYRQPTWTSCPSGAQQLSSSSRQYTAAPREETTSSSVAHKVHRVILL